MTLVNCDLCHKKAEFVAKLQPYPDLTRRFFGSYAACYGHEKLRQYLDKCIEDIRTGEDDVPSFFCEA